MKLTDITNWPRRLRSVMLSSILGVLFLANTSCIEQSPVFTRVPAKTSPSTVPLVVQSKLAKGINFSLWFAQRKDYPWKVLFERVTPNDFKAVKSAGFTHVRIPIEPESLEWDPNTRRFNSTRLGFFKQNLDEIRKLGLYIIIDFHPQVDKQARLRNSSSYRNEIINFWQDLIKVLVTIPPDQIGFEAYNEPDFQDQKLWASYQGEMLSAMRAEAPKHTLFATAEPWSSIEALWQFEPYKDKNIAYVFHYYDPFVVSHQGAFWSETTKNIRGLEYPFRATNAQDVRKAQTDPNTAYLMDLYIAKKWNSKTIDDAMRRIRLWATNNQVQIICTEFGCVDKTDSNSRGRLITDMRQALDHYKIPWSFWDYGSPMGISAEPDYWKNIESKRLQYLGLSKSNSKQIK